MKCLLYIIFIIHVNIIINFSWKEILQKIDGNSCEIQLSYDHVFINI